MGLITAVPPAGASPGQAVTDLTSMTATDLVTQMLGSGVDASNVHYTGAPESAGSFSGMGAVGFDTGIVLSSGDVHDVVGPNDSGSTGQDMGRPGDADLAALIPGYETHDASVLTFDFVPTTSLVRIDYVFASEEYNEYANSDWNDVFGFFVNGENCALTPDGDPVSVNTINVGNPDGNPIQHHAELLRENVWQGETPPPIDVQADGLTVVMHCVARVNRDVTNTMKLAIADTTDGVWDASVFIKAGSIVASHTPWADALNVTTPQSTATPLSLSGMDPDGDPITFSVQKNPLHGTLTGTAPALTYRPDPGYVGPDQLIYTASDGTNVSDQATVTINVTPAPPPVVKLTAPTSAFTLSSSATVSWTGTDPATGVLGYRLGYQRWTPTGGSAAWHYPHAWQQLPATTTSITLKKLSFGANYCFAVRGVNNAGVWSDWTAPRCVARALDDRALTKTGTWKRKTGSRYWNSTITAAKGSGATLKLSGARVDRVGIVATRGKGMGTVGVYVGSKLIGKIKLAAPNTKYRSLLALPTFSYRTGTVTVKVLTKGKPVQIDGLAVSRN